MLFYAAFYLIIGEYHGLIREVDILVLMSHLVSLSLYSNAIRLVVVLFCLLYKNSLAWAKIELCSPNSSFPYYYSTFTVKANKESHRPHL